VFSSILFPLLSLFCNLFCVRAHVLDFDLRSVLCRMGQKVAMVQKHKKFLGKLEDGMSCCMASIYVSLLKITLFILLR
jgi:hypothetical protein